jgi:hypothetical protein
VCCWLHSEGTVTWITFIDRLQSPLGSFLFAWTAVLLESYTSLSFKSQFSQMYAYYRQQKSTRYAVERLSSDKEQSNVRIAVFPSTSRSLNLKDTQSV